MKDLTDVAARVREHFATYTGASLELSDGWFGRPYDNFHRLRAVATIDQTLTIGLDEHQTLTVHGPIRAEVDGSVLTLSDFDSGTWDWTPYGSRPTLANRRAIPRGTIRFHSR